jgi:uncharacterized membrane protein YeaQ/YmgE (transglycosylase-associated protein family)
VIHMLGQMLFGLIVGAIAKLVMPGKDPGGIVVTAIIGMLGSIVGSFIGRVVSGNPAYSAHWLMSILGAIILLAIYRVIIGMRKA